MLLIIDSSKKAARNLADMFHYMGFLAHGYVPTEALSRVSVLYRAIIITSPNRLPDLKDYLTRLRAYVGTVPVFAVVDEGGGEIAEYFDALLPRGAYAARMAETIMEYCNENSLDIPGHYMLAGLDVSVDINRPTYFDDPLPFTKTECMILRYLIRSYPNTVTAAKILQASYRPSRMPDVANIRTHISIINKKFREFCGEPLIQQSFGEGYKILTIRSRAALTDRKI